jgi:PRTRC genetic system protein F
MFLDIEWARLNPKGPGAVSAQGIFAPPVLSLPRLGQGIPVEYQQPGHISLQNLVRQLYRIGVVRDSDLEPDLSLNMLIEGVFRDNLKDSIGEIRLTELGLGISDGADEYNRTDGRFTANEDDRPQVHECVRFGMEVTYMPMVCIGKHLQALEDIAAGLGETVYAVLTRSAWGGLGLFTINTVLKDIPYLYNLDEEGEQDESDGDDGPDEDAQTAAACMEGGDDEDEDCGLPTREQLREAMPSWAVHPKFKLTPDQLRDIATRKDVPQWVRFALEQTIATAQAWDDGVGQIGNVDLYDAGPVYYQAAVRFSDDDAMQRAVDDYIEMANNCSDSYTPMVHLMEVDLRDTDKVRKWWDGMLKGCKLLHAIDQLLYVLDDDQ